MCVLCSNAIFAVGYLLRVESPEGIPPVVVVFVCLLVCFPVDLFVACCVTLLCGSALRNGFFAVFLSDVLKVFL